MGAWANYLLTVAVCIGMMPNSLAAQRTVIRQDEEKGQTQKVSAIDIIPAHACIAIATNDIGDFQRRLENEAGKLVDKNGFLKFAPMILPYARNYIKEELGVKECVDENAPSAIVLTSIHPTKGEPAGFVTLPISSEEVAAKELFIDLKDLKTGNPIEFDHNDDGILNYLFDGPIRYVSMKNKRLYFASSKEIIKKAIGAKSIRSKLNKDEIKTLENEDLIVYANPQKTLEGADEKAKKQTINDFWFTDTFSDPPKTEDVSLLSLGIRVDDGIGLSILAHAKDGVLDDAFSILRDTAKRTSLEGLPDGKVVAATALVGSKELPQMMAELFNDSYRDYGLFNLFPKGYSVSRRNKLNFFTILEHAWKDVEQSKFAVYLNDHPNVDGLFTAIAILDTKDPKQFIGDMTSLERFVNASLLPPNEGAKILVGKDKLIDELILQLGARKYKKRELAASKLKLIGADAIPALKRAMESSDFEVRSRADQILKSFAFKSIAKQKEAFNFDSDMLATRKIQFAYKANQEKVLELPTDHILVISDAKSNGTGFTEDLQKVFGKNWSEIRLTPIGNQIVFSWGSQKGWHQKTLQNIRDKKPGLAARDRFPTFSARTSQENIAQAVFSMEQIKHLLPDRTQMEPVENTSSAISFGFLLKPNRLRLDLHATIPDLQIMIQEVDSNW